MFEGPDYPQSLDEELFEEWLEKGRQSKISYEFMAVIWDDFDKSYSPRFLENRDEFSEFRDLSHRIGSEWLIAIYDLYSESRLNI